MNLSWEFGMCAAVAVLIHVAVFIFVMRKRPKTINGRHVVITGGSKGIGLSLAVECAMKGADVTVIARNDKMLSGAVALMEVIRQNPGQKFQYRCLDVSSSYDEVKKVFDEICNELGSVYMLINCAGLAICGVFEEVSVEDARKLMEVNYFGSYYCTRYVLPKMKKAREGIIVVTASQAALLGIYGYGPYAASKFALRGMAETIAMESRHMGVFVTLALPADTNTPGFECEQKTKPLETKMISSSGGLAQPEQVAKQILSDALKGNFVSTFGVESRLLTVLGGGLFRWEGFLQALLHAVLLGPLRIFCFILHLHFERIIKTCETK